MHPNQAKIEKFVEGHIAIAATKSPEAAERHLTSWADWVADQTRLLECANRPAHLVGVNAFDLSIAIDRLHAAAMAASKREAA